MEDIGLIHGRILVMKTDNTKKNTGKPSPEEKKKVQNSPEGVLDLEELDMVSGGDRECGLHDPKIDPPCTMNVY